MEQEPPSQGVDGNRVDGNRGLQTRTGEQVYSLPSGRTLVVSPGANQKTDQLEILSPDGQVEVEILLTPNGPLVRVHGGGLKMTSTQSIQLEAAGSVEIQAEELRVRTTRSVHLDGETIRLNCQNQPVNPVAVPKVSTHCEKCSGPGKLSLPEPDQA